MRNLRIEYTVCGVFKKEKNLLIPEGWMDLSSSQFSVCSDAICGRVSEDDFIREFFSISKRLVNKLTRFERFTLIECIEFITEPRAVVNYFYLDHIPGTKLNAPNKKLQNVSFEQFMLFDTFFFDYINGSDPSNLHKFVASLYLKPSEIVTEIDFSKRVSYIAKHIDKSTLDAIFLNYTFIRKWLSTVFPYLFEYNEEDEDLESEKVIKPVSKNRPDWNSILDGLIGDDVLNERQYKELSCLRAFKTINNRIKTFKTHGK